MHPAANTPATDVAPRPSTAGCPSANAQPSAISSNGSSAHKTIAWNGTLATPDALSIQTRPGSACHAVASGRAITRADPATPAAARPAADDTSGLGGGIRI